MFIGARAVPIIVDSNEDFAQVIKYSILHLYAYLNINL